MNPKGVGDIRRSLLARNIFMSLPLLQILSNSVLAFLLKPLKKKTVGRTAFFRYSVLDQKGISPDGTSFETFFEVLRFFLGVSTDFTGSFTSDSSRRLT